MLPYRAVEDLEEVPTFSLSCNWICYTERRKANRETKKVCNIGGGGGVMDPIRRKHKKGWASYNIFPQYPGGLT